MLVDKGEEEKQFTLMTDNKYLGINSCYGIFVSCEKVRLEDEEKYFLKQLRRRK